MRDLDLDMPLLQVESICEWVLCRIIPAVPVSHGSFTTGIAIAHTDVEMLARAVPVLEMPQHELARLLSGLFRRVRRVPVGRTPHHRSR